MITFFFTLDLIGLLRRGGASIFFKPAPSLSFAGQAQANPSLWKIPLSLLWARAFPSKNWTLQAQDYFELLLNQSLWASSLGFTYSKPKICPGPLSLSPGSANLYNCVWQLAARNGITVRPQVPKVFWGLIVEQCSDFLAGSSFINSVSYSAASLPAICSLIREH